jgi:hypothetical protein
MRLFFLPLDEIAQSSAMPAQKKERASVSDLVNRWLQDIPRGR